ncbi:putative baseplate assembly protein [Vitiosangium sp. GDMCC 1.1324]|uniref:putative baseplate assembly protein n=1 Tax=Vitiosangium sp. (strain GDMCC 1.1324) TaxID=2138576 RepID=UPI000D357E9B|nr:putative baseplate assembly protein [Vitiosangium sp. GDMCC 1.1324]PTL79525.1 putative baseplate assembly protein [Vitiosangium sp. GDMCC 1.1324]
MKPGVPLELLRASPSRSDRKRAVASRAGHHGLDWVEVRQVRGLDWVLRLHFIRHSAEAGGSDIPPGLEPLHLRVLDEDGQPVPATARALEPVDAHSVEALLVLERGSSAVLTHRPLTLVLEGLDSVDPVFRQAPFQLTLEHDEPAPSAPAPGPRDTAALAPASYQAKDYESFSRLLLDRMRLTVPAWQERHVADVGVMLVELLSHVGDTLSYYQDAVAAEAYLGTARRRASLRRHARLLDYTVHEGCTPRVWVHVALPETQLELELPAGTLFVTEPPAAPRSAWDVHPPQHHSCFESLDPARLYVEHNAFHPYTWGARVAELPQGTASVTLRGHYPRLRAGDVLLLEELRSSTTGLREDADPEHRHAVRLNAKPVLDEDPLDSTPLTHVSWFPEDALPFALSAGTTPDGLNLMQVLGNVVLADHGATQPEVEAVVQADGTAHVDLGNLRVVSSERYTAPVLRTRPASEMLTQQPRRALPWVQVLERRPGRDVEWSIRHELLSSGRHERHFVAEVNDGDELVLRFGDGHYGRRLPPGTRLRVRYRTGIELMANVGADRLVRMDARFAPFVESVRNPLPAQGGVTPEDAERVRRDAPLSFRTQERCVTDEDYVTLARRVPGVRAAALHLAWNGSWHVARVHVLPQDGRTPTPRLLERVRRYLAHHRLTGIEVETRPPEFVPLDIALEVGVKPGHSSGSVRRTLEQELGGGTLEDGRPAFFHPSAFSFGQPVYLAPLIARAASVHGVAWVKAFRFERWGQDESSELESGRILPGPTEVVQVEGRPGRPDLGLVDIHVTGGGR